MKARTLVVVALWASGASLLIAFAPTIVAVVIVVALAFGWTWWLDRSAS